MAGQVELQWLEKWSYNGWMSGVTMAGQVEFGWTSGVTILDKSSNNGKTSGVTMAGQVEL